MVDVLASRMAEGDFAALLDISALLDDSALFAAWASRARSLQNIDILAACLARGHPTRLREAMRVFEAAGFAKEAQEARLQLPQVASAYLAARLADAPPNMPLVIEAIAEAEAEGLDEVKQARAQLPRLVQAPILSHSPSPPPSPPLLYSSPTERLKVRFYYAPPLFGFL